MGKSTTDQIFTLRQILEKSRKYIITHHLFIDLKNACDRVGGDNLYSDTLHLVEYMIRVQSGVSQPFISNKDIRKGDALTSLLYNLDLEKDLRDLVIHMNGNIFYKSVQFLVYGIDNLDIVVRSFADVQAASKQ